MRSGLQYIGIILLLSCLGLLRADITLSVDDLEVTLYSERSFTIGDIKRKGNIVCDSLNSNQGTLLSIDDVFRGSGHGYEEVLGINLHVDGQVTQIQEGTNYVGGLIEFHRRTCIAKAYILNSTLTLSTDRIEEYVELQGMDPTKDCSVFYGFGGSKTNRLSEYAAFDKNVVLLSSGAANRNNDSVIYFEAATAVAQYDPIKKDGVLSWTTRGSEYGLSYFIWDRNTDNKLYAQFDQAQGPCALENKFQIKQIVFFFDAGTEPWFLVPQRIMAGLCQEEIEADLNHDCWVTLEDLAILTANWMVDESKVFAIPGDIDRNMKVDMTDFRVLTHEWLSSPPEMSADIAPIPVGDGSVNLRDFSALSRYWNVDVSDEAVFNSGFPK